MLDTDDSVQDVARPLLYRNVSLSRYKIRPFLEVSRNTRTITTGLQILGDERTRGIDETSGMLAALLALLPQLKRICYVNEVLRLPQAFLLAHISGDTLLHLSIHLEESQAYVPETLASVGQLQRLQTMQLKVTTGYGHYYLRPMLTPIMLPTLRTLRYELVHCTYVLPWLRFLGLSSFPELQTLSLYVDVCCRRLSDVIDYQALSAVRPLLEQHPRLRRLQADNRLGWNYDFVRALLAQPMSVRELSIFIPGAPYVPAVLALPPTIATLELYEQSSFDQVIAVIQAIVAGLAARAPSRLRCIRLGAGTWDEMLQSSRRRSCPHSMRTFSKAVLADARDFARVLRIAQSLRTFGVTLHDSGGKGIDEGTRSVCAK
jgi:hypothetical protein